MNLVILYMYESAAFFTDKSYMLRKIVASFIIWPLCYMPCCKLILVVILDIFGKQSSHLYNINKNGGLNILHICFTIHIERWLY